MQTTEQAAVDLDQSPVTAPAASTTAPAASTTAPAAATTASAVATTVETLEENSLVPRKFNFLEVETQFEDTYMSEDMNNSAILDMIAVYLKGQKILYTESKTLCEQRLNYLMLPAIFNTAICTILSLVLKDFTYGATIVSCLNGINAFLLAVINYLKLDARAEAHRTSAYKFDKIQSSTVFSSGRVLFGALDRSKVVELIDKVEKEVSEIKESNQFVLPEFIRTSFPTLYGTNVFAEVKVIMNGETVEMNKLRDILNDREIARVDYLKSTNENRRELKLLYDGLMQKYRNHLEYCIAMREKYKALDGKLEDELHHIISKRRRWYRFNLCNCLKN